MNWDMHLDLDLGLTIVPSVNQELKLDNLFVNSIHLLYLLTDGTLTFYSKVKKRKIYTAVHQIVSLLPNFQ